MEKGDYLFSGLKVLDVGTWIAGPVAATILADFGASVIKVETPGAGDPYRALSGGVLSPRAPMNYMWLADRPEPQGAGSPRHLAATGARLRCVRHQPADGDTTRVRADIRGACADQ